MEHPLLRGSPTCMMTSQRRSLDRKWQVTGWGQVCSCGLMSLEPQFHWEHTWHDWTVHWKRVEMVNFMRFYGNFLKLSALQLLANLPPFHLLSKCLYPLTVNYTSFSYSNHEMFQIHEFARYLKCILTWGRNLACAGSPLCAPEEKGSHLILITTQPHRYFSSHFIGEVTEAQRAWGHYLRIHS